MVGNSTVYMDEKEIKVKNGKTEITITGQAISVLAPKIEIKSNQESDK